MKRALVVRGGALGDLILTLPVIRALGREFGTIDVLANRRFRELVAETTFALDDPALGPFFVANAQLPDGWRDYFRRHELVISYLHDPAGTFERNVRACGVTNFLIGPHRIAAGAHATEQLAQPLAQLGMRLSDFAPRIALSQSERELARARFESPFVALHPGSGSPQKNWPIENWIALINQLLVSGNDVVIIGGEADEKEIARVRGRFGERLRYAIEWPLRKLAALLADTNFVGHDSGISHLAAATGTRCLILFGATDPKTWAPRNKHARVIVAPSGDLRQLPLTQVRDALEL